MVLKFNFGRSSNQQMTRQTYLFVKCDQMIVQDQGLKLANQQRSPHISCEALSSPQPLLRQVHQWFETKSENVGPTFDVEIKFAMRKDFRSIGVVGLVVG